MNSVILLGSSNSNGNTKIISNIVADKTNSEVIDLKQLNISEFDYDFKNRDDDFHPLVKNIVDNYDLIILATPVYWYTMSARMKIFIDRLSDCLKIRQEIGRKLKGKKIAVVSCGSDEVLKSGFHMPFQETAKYLGMVYVGNVHGWVEEDLVPTEVVQSIEKFSKKLHDIY